MTEKRNIQRIAPFLADDFVDLDEPIFDTDTYSTFLNNNANRLGTFKKYLICKLHDSWVIDTKKDYDSFTITLNDFSTYVFADTLIEKSNLTIDSDHISFPLTIELAGNLKVEFNKVDDDGNLIQINQTKLDEYLYEQVTHIDKEQIEIVFHFWKSNLKDNKPGERIIVIVSANNLTLTENQDQSWTEIFGDKFDELYRYFKEQFDSDRYVSDQNECEKLIDEFEQNKLTNERKPTA
jgi:hypothetical protein